MTDVICNNGQSSPPPPLQPPTTLLSQVSQHQHQQTTIGKEQTHEQQKSTENRSKENEIFTTVIKNEQSDIKEEPNCGPSETGNTFSSCQQIQLSNKAYVSSISTM